MPDIPFRSRASFKAGAALDTNQGIFFAGGSPISTSSQLYSIGSTLYWDGSAITSGGGYVPLTGDSTITGIKTFGDGSTSSITEWNKSASGSILLACQTAGVDRFNIIVKDQELGSDSGANVYFANYTDAGVLYDYSIKWVRATGGAITIGGTTRPVYFTGGYVGIGTITPTSYTHNGKSVSNEVTTTTINLTLTDQHNTIYCDNTSSININLPAASSCKSREYTVIRGNTGLVTINDGGVGGVLSLLSVQGLSITYISNGTVWSAKNSHVFGSQASTWSYTTDFFYDFHNSVQGTPFVASIGGSGATAVDAGAPDSSHAGVLGLTISSSGGRATIWTGGLGIILGNGTLTLEVLLKTGTLATSNQDYVLYVGLIDSNNSLPTDGVFFEYDRSHSTSWRLCANSNSTLTATTSAVTVEANTWYKLRIEIMDTPATATFYINDVLAGTVVGGIPVGAGRNTGYGIQVRKTVGSTGVTTLVDYFYAMQSFRNVR